MIQVVSDQRDGASPTFQITFDPDRPDSVHARAIAEMHIARLGVGGPTVKLVESRSSRGRYVDYLVPGLLAVNAMGASLVWFGYGLAELRMPGLLRESPFVDATRAMMLDGSGLAEVAQPLLALTCWALASGSIGLLFFRPD